MGGLDTRDRPPDGGNTLSGHGALAYRGAPSDKSRLPALRYSARGAADASTAEALLREACRDPARAEPEASEFRRLARRRHVDGETGFAGPDELHSGDLEVQQGL